MRTYKEDVRKRILASIERIVKGVAASAGIPKIAPTVKVSEGTGSTYNELQLVDRLVATFKQARRRERGEGAADYGERRLWQFSLDQKIPATIFWLGASDPAKVKESRETGVALPGLHSALFAPVPEPTLRTGVKAMTSAVLELMKK